MSLYRSSSSASYGRYPYDHSSAHSSTMSSVLNGTLTTNATAEKEYKTINKTLTSGIDEHQDFRRYDVMAKLLISGFMSDCKFIVGPDNETAEIIPGHKLLFTLASPVFEEMFNGGFKEAAKDSEIRITDTEPRDFKNFRYIIYNNDAAVLSSLSVEDVIQVYILSDKYMATEIAKYCLKYITKLLPKMSTEDVILVFQFALGLEDKVLLQTVKDKIKTLETKNCKKLNELNEDEFYEYVLVLRAVNKTLDMFSIIQSYFETANICQTEEGQTIKSDTAKEDNEKTDKQSSETYTNSRQNEKLLKKCLKCLDFGNVSAEDFKKGPGESKILTFEQKYYILSRLGSANSVILN